MDTEAEARSDQPGMSPRSFEVDRTDQADPNAGFEQLVHRHASGVLATARAITHDHSAAEDICQDVFTRYWAQRDAYDPTRGTIEAWLKVLARSTAIDWVRRETSQQLRAPRNHPNTTEHERHEDTTVDALCLRSAMARLPPDQADAIALAYLHGLSYRAVATHLHISEGTAKSRIRLGLRHLARLI